jgi:hypothetical protein
MRSATRRPVMARLLGSLFLVTGAVLMALSTSGGGRASALERISPPSLLSAAEAPVCDAAGEHRGDAAAAVPAERCAETSTTKAEADGEAEARSSTTSCSTTDEESTDPNRQAHQDPGRSAATTTTTTTSESTGRAQAAAGTGTAPPPPPPPPAAPATLAAGISGASTMPRTAVSAPAKPTGAAHSSVTAVPVTGASPPFALGLALGVGGLGLVGLSTRRRRRTGD